MPQIFAYGGSQMDLATHLSQQHLSVSVIIPARNEAPNLQYVLPHIPSFVTEVILVDGHSTDDTVAVGQHLLPTIRIVEQIGKGKGDAIRAGLAASTGDIIVLADADGSADPLEISRFVETLLAGNDFAKGSRFINGGGSHDITLIRRAGNYGLILLVNILFGTRFSDLCYGYNAFWKHCLDHIEIDSDGFEIETLINIRMHLAGLKITEVPSIEYQRIHGLSNLNAIKDGWRILKLILNERKRGKLQSAVPIIQRQTEEVVL
jgi:glycosyltransferase involved in cell wall biosynthesis